VYTCIYNLFVFKSGVLRNVFILSKHGTEANIRSTKMTNNRHAYNRDVLQSYWTSDGLPLYCSQPTGEKTHTNQQCERLYEAETGSRLTNGSCAMSLNSNHIVLNTMSNVFVDVGLPTVDV
jgi:hypothetical protein